VRGQTVVLSAVGIGEPPGPLVRIDADGTRTIVRTFPASDPIGDGRRVEYDRPNRGALLNASGHVVFQSTGTVIEADGSRGPRGEVLLRLRDNGATLLNYGFLGQGTLAPLQQQLSYAVNSTGQVAFLTRTADQHALWLTDIAGRAYMVARVGQALDVDPDPLVTDLRTVSSINVSTGSGGQDGRPRALNDRGELVFVASFSDLSSTVLLARVPGGACGAHDVASAGGVPWPDGALTADDIIVFVGWFFAADARADVAGAGQTVGADGQFTADDIILFVNRFVAGC
jgi:hypothetical protein